MVAIHDFDLSGGSLCLDFTNTVEDRPRADSEHLGEYRDLLGWARQTGILSARQSAALERQAEREPSRAAAAFKRSLALRETLYRIFARIARSESPRRGDLERLNSALRKALPHLEIDEVDDGFGWRWTGAADAWDRPLWPVVRSAADLLTSDDSTAIRECAAEGCSWLFVDRSRNRRRRWCDMTTCGNRAKARRHYERRKRNRAG